MLIGSMNLTKIISPRRKLTRYSLPLFALAAISLCIILLMPLLNNHPIKSSHSKLTIPQTLKTQLPNISDKDFEISQEINSVHKPAAKPYKNISSKHRPNNQTRLNENANPNEKSKSADFNQFCPIPNYQPQDSTTKLFSKKLPPPKCEGVPWITVVERRALFLNVSLLRSLGERVEECRYEEILRLSDKAVEFSEPVVFRESVRPQADFVRVRCDVLNVKSKKMRTHTAYHFIMREKPSLENTLQERLRQRKRRSRDLILLARDGISSPDWVNVIMLGVDSVSRHNMIRLMPKTRHILLDKLRAVEMTNYNKISENTFPNLFALNAGMTLEEAGWEGRVQRILSRDKAHWETLGYRLLWQDFAQQGYRTLYVEDEYRINTFYLENLAFRDEPTHYYGRTLEIAKEDHSGMYSHGGQCFGGKSSDQLMLSYPLEYMRLFRTKPHFALIFLVRTTHNTMNGPSQVDGQVSDFLTKLLEEQLITNTVLVVFSDHGLRYGPFRATPVGKFEDARPFMFLVFPDWFQKQYPYLTERVQRNAARFTAPLDIHATLLDLLFLTHVDPLQEKRKNKHGISLFKTIPTNRTCMSAGVPAQHCVCLTARPVSTTSHLAYAAGTALVETLNESTRRARHKCRTLTLSKIIGFVQLEGGDDYLHHFCLNGTGDDLDSSELASYDNRKALYRVSVTVSPGGGWFEATLVKCNTRSPFKYMDAYDEICRLNHYGNTSSCVVRSRSMEKSCYCRGQ